MQQGGKCSPLLRGGGCKAGGVCVICYKPTTTAWSPSLDREAYSLLVNGI